MELMKLLWPLKNEEASDCQADFKRLNGKKGHFEYEWQTFLNPRRFLRKRAFFCIEIDPFIDLDRSEINIYCYHTNARGIFQNDVLILVRCFCWLIFFCHIIRVPPKKGLSIFVFVFGYSGAKETFRIVCVLLQKSLIHIESIVWPMYTIQIKAKTKYK